MKASGAATFNGFMAVSEITKVFDVWVTDRIHVSGIIHHLDCQDYDFGSVPHELYNRGHGDKAIVDQKRTDFGAIIREFS
jgi:hypothetical protein